MSRKMKIDVSREIVCRWTYTIRIHVGSFMIDVHGLLTTSGMDGIDSKVESGEPWYKWNSDVCGSSLPRLYFPSITAVVFSCGLYAAVSDDGYGYFILLLLVLLGTYAVQCYSNAMQGQGNGEFLKLWMRARDLKETILGVDMLVSFKRIRIRWMAMVWFILPTCIGWV